MSLERNPLSLIFAWTTMDNWAGIVKLPGEWRLGAIEGQVFHHVARRWKRQLARVAGEWLQTRLPVLEGSAADRPWVKHVLRELARAEQRLW